MANIVNGVGVEIGNAVEKVVEKVIDTATAVLGAVGTTVLKIEDTVSDLGGKIGDIIEATRKAIPQIALAELTVFDSHGRRVTLTLEIPNGLELSCPIEEAVFFTLYTDTNYRGEPLFINVDSLRRSSFQPHLDTVFIIHGWLDSNRSKASTLLKDGKNKSFLE